MILRSVKPSKYLEAVYYVTILLAPLPLSHPILWGPFYIQNPSVDDKIFSFDPLIEPFVVVLDLLIFEFYIFGRVICEIFYI